MSSPHDPRCTPVILTGPLTGDSPYTPDASQIKLSSDVIAESFFFALKNALDLGLDAQKSKLIYEIAKRKSVAATAKQNLLTYSSDESLSITTMQVYINELTKFVRDNGFRGFVSEAPQKKEMSNSTSFRNEDLIPRSSRVGGGNESNKSSDTGFSSVRDNAILFVPRDLKTLAFEYTQEQNRNRLLDIIEEGGSPFIDRLAHWTPDDKEANPNPWTNFMKQVFVGTSEMESIVQLAQMKSKSKNAILFCMASWCGACVQCRKAVNELVLLVLSKSRDKAYHQKPLPAIMVFDAERFLPIIYDCCPGMEARLSYPAVFLIRDGIVSKYDPSKLPRTAENLFMAWETRKFETDVSPEFQLPKGMAPKKN